MGLPKVFGTSLSVLVTGMPDIGSTLVASGLIALVWGPLRTALAYFALRGAQPGERRVATKPVKPALAQK